MHGTIRLRARLHKFQTSRSRRRAGSVARVDWRARNPWRRELRRQVEAGHVIADPSRLFLTAPPLDAGSAVSHDGVPCAAAWVSRDRPLAVPREDRA
jgi:hypothetical protein